jgi:hypothetical protein
VTTNNVTADQSAVPALALLSCLTRRRIRLGCHWPGVHHLLGSFLKAPGILGSGEFAPPLCLGKPLMPVLEISVGTLPAHQLHRLFPVSLIGMASVGQVFHIHLRPDSGFNLFPHVKNVGNTAPRFAMLIIWALAPWLHTRFSI